MVLQFIAAFMLLSAVVSFLNDHDSAFYPLLLSSFLTALLGLFPLIFAEKAEDIKIKIGSAMAYEGEGKMEVKGRNLVDGLPKNVTITSEEIREALADGKITISDLDWFNIGYGKEEIRE